MPVKVKICGVRTPSIVEAAAEAGADYVGLVFFLKSPRNVTPEEGSMNDTTRGASTDRPAHQAFHAASTRAPEPEVQFEETVFRSIRRDLDRSVRIGGEYVELRS